MDEEKNKIDLQKSTDDTEPSNETKSDVQTQTQTQEESNGFFHVTRKFKWIFSLSMIILIVTGILMYSKWNGVLGAEYWQVAIWGLCGLLSIYSILKRSVAALILNLILFLVISLIPAWGLVYKFFKPVLELLFGTKLPDWIPYHY